MFSSSSCRRTLLVSTSRRRRRSTAIVPSFENSTLLSRRRGQVGVRMNCSGIVENNEVMMMMRETKRYVSSYSFTSIPSSGSSSSSAQESNDNKKENNEEEGSTFLSSSEINTTLRIPITTALSSLSFDMFCRRLQFSRHRHLSSHHHHHGSSSMHDANNNNEGSGSTVVSPLDPRSLEVLLIGDVLLEKLLLLLPLSSESSTGSDDDDKKRKVLLKMIRTILLEELILVAASHVKDSILHITRCGGGPDSSSIVATIITGVVQDVSIVVSSLVKHRAFDVISHQEAENNHHHHHYNESDDGMMTDKKKKNQKQQYDDHRHRQLLLCKACEDITKSFWKAANYCNTSFGMRGLTLKQREALEIPGGCPPCSSSSSSGYHDNHQVDEVLMERITSVLRVTESLTEVLPSPASSSSPTWMPDAAGGTTQLSSSVFYYQLGCDIIMEVSAWPMDWVRDDGGDNSNDDDKKIYRSCILDHSQCAQLAAFCGALSNNITNRENNNNIMMNRSAASSLSEEVKVMKKGSANAIPHSSSSSSSSALLAPSSSSSPIPFLQNLFRMSYDPNELNAATQRIALKSMIGVIQFAVDWAASSTTTSSTPNHHGDEEGEGVGCPGGVVVVDRDSNNYYSKVRIEDIRALVNATQSFQPHNHHHRSSSPTLSAATTDVTTTPVLTGDRSTRQGDDEESSSSSMLLSSIGMTAYNFLGRILTLTTNSNKVNSGPNGKSSITTTSSSSAPALFEVCTYSVHRMASVFVRETGRRRRRVSDTTVSHINNNREGGGYKKDDELHVGIQSLSFTEANDLFILLMRTSAMDNEVAMMTNAASSSNTTTQQQRNSHRHRSSWRHNQQKKRLAWRTQHNRLTSLLVDRLLATLEVPTQSPLTSNGNSGVSQHDDDDDDHTELVSSSLLEGSPQVFSKLLQAVFQHQRELEEDEEKMATGATFSLSPSSLSMRLITALLQYGYPLLEEALLRCYPREQHQLGNHHRKNATYDVEVQQQHGNKRAQSILLFLDTCTLIHRIRDHYHQLHGDNDDGSSHRLVMRSTSQYHQRHHTLLKANRASEAPQEKIQLAAAVRQCTRAVVHGIYEVVLSSTYHHHHHHATVPVTLTTIALEMEALFFCLQCDDSSDHGATYDNGSCGLLATTTTGGTTATPWELIAKRLQEQLVLLLNKKKESSSSVHHDTINIPTSTLVHALYVCAKLPSVPDCCDKLQHNQHHNQPVSTLAKTTRKPDLSSSSCPPQQSPSLPPLWFTLIEMCCARLQEGGVGDDEQHQYNPGNGRRRRRKAMLKSKERQLLREALLCLQSRGWILLKGYGSASNNNTSSRISSRNCISDAKSVCTHDSLDSVTVASEGTELCPSPFVAATPSNEIFADIPLTKETITTMPTATSSAIATVAALTVVVHHAVQQNILRAEVHEKQQQQKGEDSKKHNFCVAE